MYAGHAAGVAVDEVDEAEAHAQYATHEALSEQAPHL